MTDEAKIDAVRELFTSAKRCAKIEAMTDAEVAAVVSELAGAQSVTSAVGDLYAEIALRLRRADGGPCRGCSWCGEVATHESEGQWACEAHRGKR